jgi:transcriptional regulator with XRE-family HTH domain
MTKPRLNAGAAKLRIWLVNNKVAQDEFARRVKKSNSTLVNLTSGRATPSPEFAATISIATAGMVRPLDWLEPYDGQLSRVPEFRRGRRSNASLLANSQATITTHK